MLKKAFRLPADASFSNAKSIHTEYAIIKFQKNALTYNRFGFVVSKRISKSAVIRNAVKRRIRSCIEKNMNSINQGYDMLLLIRRALKVDEKVKCSEIIDTINRKLI